MVEELDNYMRINSCLYQYLKLCRHLHFEPFSHSNVCSPSSLSVGSTCTCTCNCPIKTLQTVLQYVVQLTHTILYSTHNNNSYEYVRVLEARVRVPWYDGTSRVKVFNFEIPVIIFRFPVSGFWDGRWNACN